MAGLLFGRDTMNWLLILIAKLNGFTDKDLAQIAQALPATRKVIDLLIQAEPLLEDIGPIANDLVKEWKVIGPAVATALSVMGQRVGAGESPMDTLVAIRNALIRLEPKGGKLPQAGEP